MVFMPQIFHIWGISFSFKVNKQIMDRRITKTKKSIQDAYFSMIMEKNSPKISITELAARANIDRKTFYLHYETTDDIIREFKEDKINQLVDMLEKNNYFANPLEYSYVFSALNHLILEDIELYRFLAGNPVFASFWENIKERLINTCLSMYSDMIPLPKDILDFYVRFFSAAIISIYVDYFEGRLDTNIEDLSKKVTVLMESCMPVLATNILDGK